MIFSISVSVVILLFSELRCVEVKDELSRFGKCQRFNGAVSRVCPVLFGFVSSCDPVLIILLALLRPWCRAAGSALCCWWLCAGGSVCCLLCGGLRDEDQYLLRHSSPALDHDSPCGQHMLLAHLEHQDKEQLQCTLARLENENRSVRENVRILKFWLMHNNSWSIYRLSWSFMKNKIEVNQLYSSIHIRNNNVVDYLH